MDSSEPLPKLRMAPPESAEDLARRVEREQRAAVLQRESNLEQSLAPFRVGSVRYLNAVPLTRGLEDEVTYTTPAKLAELLQRDELDAALVSVVEVLLHDRYDILDGIAIASLGEVQSVLLAHRKPLAEARDFGLDTLDSIIRSRTEYDLDFRQDYLGWHIHYHLGTDEKRGLARFIELLRRHGVGPIFEPKFVT